MGAVKYKAVRSSIIVILEISFTHNTYEALFVPGSVSYFSHTPGRSEAYDIDTGLYITVPDLCMLKNQILGSSTICGRLLKRAGRAALMMVNT